MFIAPFSVRSHVLGLTSVKLFLRTAWMDVDVVLESGHQEDYNVKNCYKLFSYLCGRPCFKICEDFKTCLVRSQSTNSSTCCCAQGPQAKSVLTPTEPTIKATAAGQLSESENTLCSICAIVHKNMVKQQLCAKTKCCFDET